MRPHLPAPDHGRMDPAPAPYLIRINGHLGATVLSANSTSRQAQARVGPYRPRVRSVQGWTGPLGPRSRRSDCMMANVVVLVNTSMSAAASTPVYLATMGAAARSVTASR